MHTRTFAAALLAATMLAGCGMGASYPNFAETEYRIEGNATSPEGETQRMIIFRDGPKMRVETMLAGRGPAAIVFDEATNGAYVVDAAARTAVIAEGADTPEPMEAAWAALGGDNAERVGACSVAGEDGNEWRARDEPEGHIACITNDGIVLKVRDGDRVIFEATQLDRGAQDDALFGVPAGYTVVDPTSVLSQVGDTLEQTESVTGETADAPAAPPARTPAPAPQN